MSINISNVRNAARHIITSILTMAGNAHNCDAKSAQIFSHFINAFAKNINTSALIVLNRFLPGKNAKPRPFTNAVTVNALIELKN